MITIIDYGAGNIKSIQNMLSKIGAQSQISNKAEDIQNAKKLILPGVGHFKYGMDQLMKSGLIEVLYEKAIVNQIPFLGICLGAQLLGKRSDEGDVNGLGWIDMEVVKFDKSRMGKNERIPHMGWNYISLKQQSSILADLPEDPRFYFVHSYHIKCNTDIDILCTTKYGYEFTAGVKKDNIFGVQFHPEKSHKFGMKLLQNFTNI